MIKDLLDCCEDCGSDSFTFLSHYFYLSFEILFEEKYEIFNFLETAGSCLNCGTFGHSSCLVICHNCNEMSDHSLRRSNRVIEQNCQKRVDDNSHQTKDEVIGKSHEIKNQSKKRKAFICEKCSSNEAKQVFKKSNRRKYSVKLKKCFDSSSEKWFKVCNNCAKLMTQKKKSEDISVKLSIEEQKRKYLSNCQSFGLSLVQLLNDSSADRLFCPNLRITGKACACLQRYVIGTDNDLKDKQERAQQLLDLLIKAKHLSQQKCYSMSNPKSGQKIGLGNGHKKCKEFEDFVKIQRNYLRNDLKFCEKAVQRVLFYSNNFLHKKLKTEPNERQRVERKKGTSVTEKLIDINLLSDHFCCSDGCVQLCLTRPQLLEQWRQRAAIGQLEARRVLAEMLTPTQAVRSNCFKFVSLVTGSSIRTISKVNDYLISNGGNREPEDHGLRKFYVINDKRRTAKHNNPSNRGIAQNSSNNNLPESGPSLRTNSLPINSLQINNRIDLIVNQTNNEISVINSGRKQTIAILSSPMNLISGGQQTIQIPLSITSQMV